MLPFWTAIVALISFRLKVGPESNCRTSFLIHFSVRVFVLQIEDDFNFFAKHMKILLFLKMSLHPALGLRSVCLRQRLREVTKGVVQTANRMYTDRDVIDEILFTSFRSTFIHKYLVVGSLTRLFVAGYIHVSVFVFRTTTSHDNNLFSILFTLTPMSKPHFLSNEMNQFSLSRSHTTMKSK